MARNRIDEPLRFQFERHSFCLAKLIFGILNGRHTLVGVAWDVTPNAFEHSMNACEKMRKARAAGLAGR